MRLLDRGVQLVAQAQVQREARRNLPVVLAKECVGITQTVHGGVVGGTEFRVVRIAEQEGGVRVADAGAHVRRSVEDIPTGAVVAEDVVVVVGDPLEVGAELEGVLSRGPAQVVERLNDLAALHAGVARARGHEAVDEHLRRLGPGEIGLENGGARLAEDCRGRIALCLRSVLRVVAAAKFVEQPGGEDVVVRKSEPLVYLRRVVGSLQRAAGLGAIGKGAGGRGRRGDLAILVGEAGKDGLARRERVVQANVPLIRRDGRGKVDLVVVGVGVRAAQVGRRHQHLEQIRGDLADGDVGGIDGGDAVRLVDCAHALPGEIAGKVSVAHVHGGHTEHDGRLARQAQAFEADEEEGTVAAVEQMRNPDRAAQRPAEVVHDDLRLGECKGVVGVENSVLVVLEGTAMVVIGAGLGDGGDVGHPAELRAVV